MPGKIKSILLIAIFVFGSILSFGQTASQIIGKWKSDEKEKDVQMEIYLAKDGNYYGKVINDNTTPCKNGNLIIKKLSYTNEAKNYKGTMEPPGINTTLNVTVTLETANRLKVVAKKLLMSKTIYFSRVQ
jgi:hypothetical protein